jgi:hypothetical protein
MIIREDARMAGDSQDVATGPMVPAEPPPLPVPLAEQGGLNALEPAMTKSADPRNAAAPRTEKKHLNGWETK